jgi:hypothetical protein
MIARFFVQRGCFAGVLFAVTMALLSGNPAVWAVTPDEATGGFSGGAPANEITEFKGTLKGAQGNVITVTREDGTDCMVQFPDEITSLNFVATALPAYLRRGMPVRFATVLGPTGMPMMPIEKVEIFSPLPPAALPHNQSTRYAPGVHSADHKNPQRGAPLTGKVDVVGSLMMLSPQGGIAIQAGTTPVQTMVSPNAKLEIRLNNLSLAEPGDSVSVVGFYQPPDETKVKASQIMITTDRVFGEEQPKKTRTRGTKRDKAAEQADAEKDGAEAAEAENADAKKPDDDVAE